MLGYNHEYYPVQLEVIDGRRSFVSGYTSRAEAVKAAKERVATRHASTVLAGRDCTVLIHTPYTSFLFYRRPGHTNRDIWAAS